MFFYNQKQILNYYKNKSTVFLFQDTIDLINNKIENLTTVIDVLKSAIGPKRYFFCIDGPISAGKTTLIKKNFKNNTIVDEPIKLWRMIKIKYCNKKTNIFSLFYSIKNNEIKNICKGL